MNTNINMNTNTTKTKIKPRMYAFILPNGIKYRITQTSKLVAFRFDESNVCTKVHVKDAISYIMRFETKDIHIAINTNIVAMERKRDIIDGLNMLVQFKDITPKRKHKDIQSLLAQSPQINETMKSMDEINSEFMENKVKPNIKHDVKPDIKPDTTFDTKPDTKSSNIAEDIVKDLIKEVINTPENLDTIQSKNSNEPDWIKQARINAEKASEEIIHKDVTS